MTDRATFGVVTTRYPLPVPFDAAPFRVCAALAEGVSRHRLDARDLSRLHHGSRTPLQVGYASSCAALTPLMSQTQAFTGITGGRLLELPMPRAAEADDRLFVSSLRPQRAMRRPGVVGTERGWGEPRDVGRLAILEPELLWIALGRVLSVVDLIAVGDRLITGTLRTPPMTSADALTDALLSAAGQPGARTARAALGRIRVGAWSRPETFIRILMEDAGLPAPRLNEPVDVGDGRFVIPDLSWPQFRVALEYDGAWHAGQQDADAMRHERLVDAGWLVVHVRSHELFHAPSEIVGRVLRRLTERGYRHGSHIDLTRMSRFVP